MSAPPDGVSGPDPTDGGESVWPFDWYHHALALAYSVSAAVSAESMPPVRLALYFLASLIGAYAVVGILTLGWWFAWARWG